MNTVKESWYTRRAEAKRAGYERLAGDALKDTQKAEKARTGERAGPVQKLVDEGVTRDEAVRKVYLRHMSDAEYAGMCRRYAETFGTR